MNDPENKSPEGTALTRDPKTGKLLPGHSGNPGGRPKLIREYQDWLMQEAYPEAKQALLECLRSKDGKVRMMAIKEIGDRLFGKAPQSVSLTGDDGGPVQVDVRAAVLGVLQKLEPKDE